MGNCCNANKDDHILDMNNVSDPEQNNNINAKVEKARHINKSNDPNYDSIDNEESLNKVVKVSHIYFYYILMYKLRLMNQKNKTNY